MKPQEGKCYRTEGGEKIGPMIFRDGAWTNNGCGVRLWRDDGDRYFTYDRGGKDRIVAEWADLDVRAYVADKAKSIVNGDRRGAYGAPEDNFERIARFWTAYFQNTGRGIEVSAQDVSPMMRLLKEARLCENPTHLDSHIDLVGYALTGAEVNGVKIPVDNA